MRAKRDYPTLDGYLADKLQDPEFARAYREAKQEADFALALARLREERGMTQTDLQEQTGIPQETISRIERGRVPALSTLKRLARALNATVSILPDERVVIEPYRKAEV